MNTPSLLNRMEGVRGDPIDDKRIGGTRHRDRWKRETVLHPRTCQNDMTTWRFEPDAFGYKDMYYDYLIKWEAFTGYRLVERNLLLQLKDSVDESFMIGEVEIGEELMQL